MLETGIMLTEQGEFSETNLSEVRKEMAISRMAQSGPDAISRQNGRLNQTMKSRNQHSYSTLSDLGRVVTRIEKFATRGKIYAQGDSAKTVLYIQKGRVAFSVASKTGKDTVVAILGPGNFFGEACLAGQATRTKTATAMTPAILQVIERNEMIRALEVEPSLAHRFLCYMVLRKIRIEEDLIDQLSQNSEKRLARALLLLAGKGNQEKLHGFAGISQGTLATMIGTTRSRVNFFMNKFRKLGFVGYHGRLDRNGGIHINTALLRKAYGK
ncbi:MAG: Crp/Fnr family transcriptional regulator [Candidatus Acidiferrum sp.]